VGIGAAIIYGIIQGLSEFLPVSSSGHLALLPHFLHTTDPGTFFDLWMHLGTALAVLVYFRSLIWQHVLLLFRSNFFLKKDVSNAQDLSLLKNLVISTVSTFILIIFLKKFALDFGRSQRFITFNMIFFGVILWLSDKFSMKNKNKLEDQNSLMNSNIRLKEAIIIGLSQAIAIFPGVSRSGITLTSSRFLGLTREHSVSYSFLLGLPVILGGIVFEVPQYLLSLGQTPQWGVWLTGLIVSFLVGLATVHLFLKWVGKIGLAPFFVYRLLLGILLIFFA